MTGRVVLKQRELYMISKRKVPCHSLSPAVTILLILTTFWISKGNAQENGVSGIIPREVLAFYYGWYGNPTVSRSWVHWREANSTLHTIQNATDYPTVGAYDSHDPDELAAQVTAAKAAGFTGFVSSWWGKDDFTDRSLAMLLNAAQLKHLHVSAYVENLPTGNNTFSEGERVAKIEYLLHQYGSHPAWLKVNGRPVVFIYSRALISGSLEMNKLFSRVRAEVRPKPIFIVDVALGADTNPHDFASIFDGVHGYNIRGFRSGMSLAKDLSIAQSNYVNWLSLATKKMISCLTVVPGADDSHLTERPKPRPITPRSDGALYTSLWQLAVADNPDWILVTSWNEWHEGTEIESSLEYGNKFLQITSDLASHFLTSPPKLH